MPPPETGPMPDSTGPTVSVVCIVRNGEAYLETALRSVLASTYPIHEIVVVDGNSTDRTAEIAAGLGARVLSQQSQGIAGAYNEGVAAANGSLIAFISHDDQWEPAKLELQVAAFAANPELKICICHVRHELDGPAAPAGFRMELLNRSVPGYIMEALVARPDAFEIVGPFDPAFSVSNDTDWFARARDRGLTIEVLPETLVRKRVHASNTTLNPGGFSQQLLDVVRASVARKRAAQPSGMEE